MAKDFNKVAIVKSKDGNGLIFVEDVNVETELSPEEPLPVTSLGAGTFSSEGVSITEESDGGDSIVDSDGDIVKSTPGTTTRTISFTVWETTNPTAMSLIYHKDDLIVDGDDVVGYDQTSRTPGNVKLIMEFETDTGKIGRRTFFNCAFKSRGEEVINVDGPNGIQVTYDILKDPSSNRYVATRIMERPASAPAA